MAQSQSRTSGGSKITTAAKKKKTAPASRPLRREVGGVICLFGAAFTLIGFFADGYWLIDAVARYFFKGLFGWGVYAAVPALVWAAYILFFHRGRPVTARLWAVLSMPCLTGAIVHTIVCGAEYSMKFTTPRQYYSTGLGLTSGGLISSYLSELLRTAITPYGTIVLLLLILMLCGLCAADTTLGEVFKRRERVPYEPQEEKPRKAPKAEKPRPKQEEPPQLFDREKEEKKSRKVKPVDIQPEEDTVPPKKEEKKPRTAARKKTTEEEPPPAEPVEVIPEKPAGYEAVMRIRENAAAQKKAEAAKKAEEKKPEPSESSAGTRKNVTASSAFDLPEDEDDEQEKATKKELRSAAREVANAIGKASVPEVYERPPLELLVAGKNEDTDPEGELSHIQERLEESLESFGIHTSIVGYTHGPTITRYEMKLAAGLKLAKLTNLSKDLALSLGVSSVRIAPIPGMESTVGVEVPNQSVSTVYLRDVLDSNAFRSSRSALTFAMGKDISGTGVVCNISKLPHLLIAGTTGSGKSVCMNSLILSLLYKSSPEELRLIMIDPKMVELGIYNGIPHLYIPVVTDPKKAAGALQWSVVEMMKRYRLFSDNGVRDIAGYNEILRGKKESPLPNLVIVIDELADLMMTAAKEVEESICRVAQMGRAAGVHLVIATQRPSADVITGLMKANIPSRIAFAVSSAMESRIILDKGGAEMLVGNGDMLFKPMGLGEPQRIQGAYVSDEEREQVINFIKAGGEAHYDESAIADIERSAAEKEREKDKKAPRSALADEVAAEQSGNFLAGYDELLVPAADIVVDAQLAAVSTVQRRLKVGYARAGRIMDQMEEIGIVGPFVGSKAREVLVDKARWQEMKMKLSGQASGPDQLMNGQKEDYSDYGN